MNTIPIFLASDDNYAPLIATTAYSILDNTKSHIDFYILDGGITSESKALIAKSLDCFTHYSLEYIDMLSIGLDDLPDDKRFTRNAFSRFFIPTVKPNIPKALYLDVDIIARGDIAELYNQDLDAYPLGAVTEDYKESMSNLLRENVYPEYKGGVNYFNAGVLLLDCDYFRKNNILDTLVSTTKNYADRLSYADQDVLNIIFDCNFKKLDCKFNFLLYGFYHFKLKYPNNAEQLKKDALLWHYNGPKPWEMFNENSPLFWHYANKTAFKDNILNRYTSFIHNKCIPSICEATKLRIYTNYILSKITLGTVRKNYREEYKRLARLRKRVNIQLKGFKSIQEFLADS